MTVAFLLFVGQMPHYWLLLLKIGSQFRDAGMPVITNLLEPRQIRNLSFIWIAATAVIVLMLPVTPVMGNRLISALLIVLTIGFMIRMFRLSYRGDLMKHWKKAFITVNLFYLVIILALIANKYYGKQHSLKPQPIMKKTFALLLIPLLAAACIRVDNAPEPDAQEAKKTDGVFIHISKGAEDTHAVLMALMLADKFSTTNDVLVFFDKNGIDMVVNDAPNLKMDAFDPSDEIFERLVNRGVEILACPACMKVAGVEKENLRNGVKLAEKERFLDFTEGRILTLDY